MRTPIPSTTATHGPFRKVVRVEDRPATAFEVTRVDGTTWLNQIRAHRREILECEHSGRMLTAVWEDPAKKRRCSRCRNGYLAEQTAKEAQ